MNRQDVADTYRRIRSNINNAVLMEKRLLSAENHNDFVEKLRKKSEFLRSSFICNEELLNSYILPIINKEQALDEEIADEFLKQIIEMEVDTENDLILTTKVLNVLKEFYEKKDMKDKIILTTFFLGVSYADRVTEESTQSAYECFDDVCQYADCYCELKDFDVRRRMLYAFYDRLINYSVNSVDDEKGLISIWEDTMVFLGNENVRKLDGDEIDFDEFIEECQMNFLWRFLCHDFRISDDTVRYLYDYFCDKDINKHNLTEYNSNKAFLYIWCMFMLGRIDCNDTVRLIFEYYLSTNKLVDFTRTDFYEEDEYQTQMVFLQEGLRFLARKDCTLPEKIEIRSYYLNDFKRLFKSVPYLNNNEYLNADMNEIMRMMLRSLVDEDLSHICMREVVVRRNIMTLIHSTIVSKIAEQIFNCVIEKEPELFVGFDGIATGDEAYAKKNLLLEYVNNAAYVHDIGKTAISDIINLQYRKITDDEFGMIKKHPKLGYDIIANTILAEKYGDVVLGHHKFYDGKAGYPENFDNTVSTRKIMIDIITIADCIDAATDMLGRNYAKSKKWMPEVLAELLSDDNHRYNRRIIELVSGDDDTCTLISRMTGEGRSEIYYDIYKIYIEQEKG